MRTGERVGNKGLGMISEQRNPKRIIMKWKGMETEIKYGRMLKTENITY